RSRHTSSYGDWSSDVCSSDLPIEADVVHWNLAVSADAVHPQDAVRSLKSRVRAVRTFLRNGGLPDAAVSEPPVEINQISLLVARSEERRVGNERRSRWAAWGD